MHRSHFDRLIVGCGYLGQQVARRWQEQGLRVAVTTRSAERAAVFAQQQLTPFVCHVLEPESLALLPSADVVLQAVGYDRQSGQSQREVYVTGLTHLLTALSGRYQKFLQISSTSVYGQSDGSFVDETSATKPLRENGEIVLEAEAVVDRLAANWLILRLSGIYGPNRLLARMNQAMTPAPIPGNPEAWLNLIHVKDAAEVIDRAATAKVHNEVILVSDDLPLQRREYYETLARLLQAPAPLFAVEEPDPKGDRGLNKRCLNQKMHQVLQPKLQFPTIATGLPEALGLL